MLEIIWFILWTLLWAVYFVLDGFDLGIGSLMPFLAGNEEQKRLMYNAAGPFWDGNEVWLISAGGITFAAFPKVYAVMFSALYAPLLLLLFCLILRATSYEFRSKVESAAWRKSWDCVHFIVNILACVVLGVFFANLFMGIPVDANGVYQGNLLKLFNVYGIAGGIFFTLIFMMHGAIWLTIKTRGPLQAKAFLAAGMLWVGVAAMLIIFLILTLFYTNIYSNYLRMPWLAALPLLAVFGLACIPRLLNAFCLAIFGIEMSEFQCRHQYVQKVLTFAKTSKLLSGFRKNFMQILKAVFGEHSPATIQQGGCP